MRPGEEAVFLCQARRPTHTRVAATLTTTKHLLARLGLIPHHQLFTYYYYHRKGALWENDRPVWLLGPGGAPGTHTQVHRVWGGQVLELSLTCPYMYIGIFN